MTTSSSDNPVNSDSLQREWIPDPDPILSNISLYSKILSYNLTLVSGGITYSGIVIPFESFTEHSVDTLRGAFGTNITDSHREIVERSLDLTFLTGQHALDAPLDDDESSEESLMPCRFIHLKDVAATGGGFGAMGTKIDQVRIPIAHVSAWFVGHPRDA